MPYRSKSPEIYYEEQNLEAFYDEAYLKQLYEEDKLARNFLSLNDNDPSSMSSSALHIMPDEEEISENHTGTSSESNEKGTRRSRKPKRTWKERFFQVFKSKKYPSKRCKSNVHSESNDEQIISHRKPKKSWKSRLLWGGTLQIVN